MPPQHQRHDFWEDLFADSLPRTHLFAAALVAIGMVILLVLTPSKPVSAYRDKSFTEGFPSSVSADSGDLTANLGAAIVEVSSNSDHPRRTQLDQVVRKGDNLSKIFKRMSLNQNHVHALANANGYSDELKNIRPGEIISVLLSENHQIEAVVYERSRQESFRFLPNDNGFKGEKLVRDTESIIGFRDITINRSLFVDGEKAGLSHVHMMKMANIFAWDIDFALDIRQGDTFSVLFEEEYIDGEKVGNGKILGAEFTNQGKTYEAVYYEDSNGNASYYSPDGRPMKKAFLRAPLDFTRVSSNYNPNRLHPIFKTKRPHRGVDYAAPTGTPVYAAGEGKVVRSGYSNSNGNFVVLEHGGAYTTKYLHLKKRLVKTGQTVRQSQAIGSVGSTGFATGPHLHYEFLVNGSHTDPRTVKLPQAEPISKREMARFQAQSSALLAELKSYKQAIAMAAASLPAVDHTL